MNLFSEIYGTYFYIVRRILETERPDRRSISRIISSEGFRDTVLFLPKKLLPGKGEDWRLLREDQDGTLCRVTKASPPRPMTLLQKRWIKAKLSDPKMRLFMNDDVLKRLEERLSGYEPLYPEFMERCTDRFSGGDDYSSGRYKAFFRTALAAVKRRELLFIRYSTGRGSSVKGMFLPIKLEYSAKNDRFRLHCRRMSGGRAVGSTIINLGRTEEMRASGRIWQGGSETPEYFEKRRCKAPAEIKVSLERNTLERFLMEFSSYEKQASRTEGQEGCTVKLWYDQGDETELLIRLLSFGPTVEITAPAELRKKAADRIRKQARLLDQY